jgi:hypothetical protein
LSIQALRQGRAIGEFQRNAILPITVNAIRKKPLPNLLAETTSAGELLPQFSGSFFIEEVLSRIFNWSKSNRQPA